MFEQAALPQDMAAFGRVAVLMGGWSNERAVSLVSGRAVLHACQALGVDAEAVDVTSMAQLVDMDMSHYDRVFIALHGDDGEGGLVQAWLTSQGITYTGSGMAASSLCMDKTKTKAVCAMFGVPCLPQVAASAGPKHVDFPLPWCLKPNREGSSLGVVRINAVSEWTDAYAQAGAFSGEGLIEPWIEGREFTVGLLFGQALPVVEIAVADGFYDYQHKYASSAVRYEVPCVLDVAEQERLQHWAKQAFEVLGCRGWARADFIQDAQGQCWFLEMNTVPGMTPKSLVPQAAAALGMDFKTLVGLILADTLSENMTINVWDEEVVK